MNESAQRKGGIARARYLSEEDRRAIAAAGARARWDRLKPERAELPRAICGSKDRPVMLGDFALPCFVLEDGRRVLAVSGVQDSLGLARGGSMIAGMNRLELFVTRMRLRPYVSDELFERVRSPVFFITPTGAVAQGYEASILPDLCDAVLAARAAGALQKQQLPIADRCELLTRALAKVGIIALIDEATGYQEIRERDELHRILQRYISPELLPWAKRFPDEFYREMYRLLGWAGRNPAARAKPSYVGVLTNRLVYEKMPPGVLEELKRRNPVVPETGRRRHRHHQLLTPDVGHPHLDKHVAVVTALMRISRDYNDFRRHFERAFPGPQGRLDLTELEAEPTEGGGAPQSPAPA